MEQKMDTDLSGSRPILVVDDDERLSKLIIRVLSRSGFQASAVATGHEAVRRALENPALFFLLDQKLHDMTGREVITTLKNTGCFVDFILMTGQGDEMLAVEMMKLGASDYLVKDTDFLDRLPKVLDRVFRAFHTEAQLKQAQEEKLRLQEQLIQSQKMDALGQLAGGVAHDFNNMLGGILGAAELLSIDPSMPVARRQELLDMIINTAKRGAELTHQLLTFSRKGLGKPVRVNCAGVIAETVAILRRTIDKAITVFVYNRSFSSEIMGDPSLLQSMFLNLGINASHAMPSGGTLTFTLSNRKLDQTEAICGQFKLKEGNYLEIDVEDTGLGMTPEIQARIFEPFFTTKEQGKGTGIGLSAVYGAVRDHNGAVTLYSEEGVGTTFYLFFPLAENRDSEEISDTPKEIRGRGLILVVDDEAMIRETAKGILESLGYHVMTASDGKEGVDIVKNQGDAIDLVILDMIMPVMGGRETFTEMKRLKPHLKIAVWSGFTRDSAVEEMKAMGLDGFIRKPYNRYDLSCMVATILNPGSISTGSHH